MPKFTIGPKLIGIMLCSSLANVQAARAFDYAGTLQRLNKYPKQVTYTPKSYSENPLYSGNPSYERNTLYLLKTLPAAIMQCWRVRATSESTHIVLKLVCNKDGTVDDLSFVEMSKKTRTNHLAEEAIRKAVGDSKLPFGDHLPIEVTFDTVNRKALKSIARDCSQLLSKSQRNERALVCRATCYAKLGKRKLAIADCEKTLVDLGLPPDAKQLQSTDADDFLKSLQLEPPPETVARELLRELRMEQVQRHHAG